MFGTLAEPHIHPLTRPFSGGGGADLSAGVRISSGGGGGERVTWGPLSHRMALTVSLALDLAH